MEKEILVTLAEGEKKRVPYDTSILELLGKKKNVIACKIDSDKKVDLSYRLNKDTNLSFITLESEEGREIMRHSTSHVMAQAVKELYRNVKIAIGPSIENGFYYDFDYNKTFSEEDLEKIEKKMKEIIKKDFPFERMEVPIEEARGSFSEADEPYKLALLDEIKDDSVSLYRQANFVDLCRGPHLPSTGRIKAFKLLSTSGAYWKGDEKNKMLQRIYGVAFPTESELEEYLNIQEEKKKRDHRRLGKQLDLFSIHEEAGAGLIIYHPKGAVLRRILEEFEITEHIKRGYMLVRGPHLLREDLWRISGHLDHYSEHMYFTEIDGQRYALKPMNCISHILIYKSRVRSYRELPLRLFEMGTVHRHEKTGVLHGLLRVREFTQDDAHIFLAEDQLISEIKGVIAFVTEVMNIFGFTYSIELSTRPQTYIGGDDIWDKATSSLKKALEESSLSYDIHEGEGAFYGPKVDVKLNDVLGRSWQCATIQCDFALPERFELLYTGRDGQRHRPVMLHRVILGAMERFMGVLIEHYGGAFPLWLAPIQVTVLTVSERHIAYAEKVYEYLFSQNFRVEKDFGNEKLSYKIRENQEKKIPYLLIIGDKEIEENKISIRKRNGELINLIETNKLVEMLKDIIRKKG